MTKRSHPSAASTSKVSETMRRIKSRDTAPEMALRKALWSRGLRYSVAPKDLPGKPDIALRKHRLAIFIDGDYWHGNQWSQRGFASIEEQFKGINDSNYWVNKIQNNIARDIDVTRKLLNDRWKVLRFWESTIIGNLNWCISEVERAMSNGKITSPIANVAEMTFIDYFAGIGLMQMGLEHQGWKLLMSNDIDANKYEMYSDQFNRYTETYVVDDIYQVNPSTIPSATLATASFPCNDLSLAGGREGLDGKQSSAFWGLIRILKRLKDRKPPIVLLENVLGFLSSKNGSDFAEALLAMNNLGYTVDAFILDAAWFLPQSRKRLFVVCLLESDNWSHRVSETLSFYESPTRPKKLAEYILQYPEIRWNIRKLPMPPHNSASLASIISDLPEESSYWWNRNRSEYLLSQMSDRHLKIAEEMINSNVWSYGTVFRRVRNGITRAELRSDGIAGCLRTPKGGSAKQILFKAGFGKYAARLLTPRECARLMGADDYNIKVPDNQAYYGFGDAVCVPVVEWIAKYYLNPVVTEMLRNRPLE